MTIIQLFEKSVALYPDNPFLFEKKKSEGYKSLSYADTYNCVQEITCGLLSIGIQPNDKVILLSEGRNDWIVAELSVLFAAAVCVPVSVRIDEPDDLRFRIIHSEARFIIVSGKNLSKINTLLDELPAVEKVIVLDDDFDAGDRIAAFKEIAEAGRKFNDINPEAFHDRKNRVGPADIANICYTRAPPPIQKEFFSPTTITILMQCRHHRFSKSRSGILP